MAFKFTNMGQLVSTDPSAARAALDDLMREHANNQGAVAAALSVHRDTLGRWLDSLDRAGYAVKGRGTAKRGPKHRRSPDVDEGDADEPRRGRVRRYAEAA